jgi:hypothetical protein
MRGLMVAALIATAGGPVAGQVGPKACTLPDTTKDWYRKQREWWALDAAHDWSNDSLRAQLIAAMEQLSPSRPGGFPVQLGVEVAGRAIGEPVALVVEARNRLREMAQKRSWPVRSMVGPAGVRAAWMIASTDSTLAVTAIHRMMEAGPGEASESDVAVLEDRFRLSRGRKQLYASQLSVGFEPAPTEDLPHVDLRRDAAYLPPLATAICMLRRP